MLEYSHTIGIVAMEGRGFEYPTDTVPARNGRMYVPNRSRDSGERGVRVTVLDLDSEYYGTFGHLGEGDGQLVSPTCAAESVEGLIYVADDYMHRVSAFDYDGGFVLSWGVRGSGEGELNGPSGLAFDDHDDVYVADTHNSRIQKFTSSGGFLHAFGSLGASEGQLRLPWGLTVAPSGDVYVADWGNDRIQRFSTGGEFVASYGTSGGEPGQLRRPSGVAVDERGYMYVSDWGNERVQVLDSDGSPVHVLRGEATLSKWASDFMATNREEAAARATANMKPDLPDVYGDDPHTESAHVESLFWAPVSIRLDDAGLVYVTEANRHRIQIYRRTPSSV